jgi:hypothetical protein
MKTNTPVSLKREPGLPKASAKTTSVVASTQLSPVVTIISSNKSKKSQHGKNLGPPMLANVSVESNVHPRSRTGGSDGEKSNSSEEFIHIDSDGNSAAGRQKRSRQAS